MNRRLRFLRMKVTVARQHIVSATSAQCTTSVTLLVLLPLCLGRIWHAETVCRPLRRPLIVHLSPLDPSHLLALRLHPCPVMVQRKSICQLHILPRLWRLDDYPQCLSSFAHVSPDESSLLNFSYVDHFLQTIVVLYVSFRVVLRSALQNQLISASYRVFFLAFFVV